MNDYRRHAQRLLSSTWKQQRACFGKSVFPSKKNATARARVIGDSMEAYRCPLCGRWHIGHNNRRTYKPAV